jgi:hypothetical protein
MPKQDMEKYHELIKKHDHVRMFVLCDDTIEYHLIKFDPNPIQYYFYSGMDCIWCNEEDLFFDLEEAKKKIIDDFTNKINAIKF